MKKILVFGASGMLGTYLSEYFLEKGYDVIRSDRSSEENAIDITDEKQLKEFVKDINPDFVINCAAYTNVNQAESEPEIANKVNGTAPKYMAEISKELGIRFIHVSTNEVFGDGAYDEKSKEFYPLNKYAESKLLGEQNIEGVGGENYYIFRTSWLYGPGARNFIKFVTDTEATEEDPLRIVTDEVGCPTYVGYLTRKIEDAVKSEIKSGIYHACSSDQLSRYDFALQILEAQGKKKPVIPIEKKDLEITRPVTSPSNQLLVKKFDDAPTSYEMLKEYVTEMGYRREREQTSELNR